MLGTMTSYDLRCRPQVSTALIQLIWNMDAIPNVRGSLGII